MKGSVCISFHSRSAPSRARVCSTWTVPRSRTTSAAEYGRVDPVPARIVGPDSLQLHRLFPILALQVPVALDIVHGALLGGRPGLL